MANYAPLVLVSGVRQQLQPADQVLANGVAARATTDLALVADSGQLVTIASGVDLQFGAATDEIGISGDMIQVQNLLDKTAAETITGAWQHNNNISFDNGTRTIAGIQNQNLVDKTAAETITMGVGDGWNFISSGDNTSPNLVVQATAAQETSTNRILFQVQGSAGGNLFSVDSEGDVNIAGAETVTGASTVSGTATFEGDVTLGNGGDTITIGSGPTDTVVFNGPLTITIPDSGNFTGLYIDNNDPTTPSDALVIDGAVANMVNIGEDDITFNTSAGNIDVNSGGALTLDASNASNFTVDSATLTLSTTTSGDVDVTAAGDVDIDGTNFTVDATSAMSLDANAASNITVQGNLDIQAYTGGQLTLDASTNIDMDCVNNFTIDSGPLSIDASGVSNLTVDGANLTVSTITSGNLILSSAGDVDIDSTNITADATSGISLDAAAASNFSVNGGALTLSTSVSGDIDITAADTLDVDASDITLDTNLSGSIGITSGNGGISIDSSSHSGSLDIDGAGVTIDSTAAFSIDGNSASNVSTTSADLTLSTITSGTLVIESAGSLTFDDGNNAGAAIPFSANSTEVSNWRSQFANETILGSILESASSSGPASNSLTLTGLTTTALTGAGQVAYLSGNDTAGLADANTLAASRTIGVYDGNSGEIVVAGRVDVQLDDAGAPSAGDPIYLDANGAANGRGTATAPTTSGDYVVFLGYVIDATGYTSAGDTVEIFLQMDRPVLI